jgi:spore coat protein CotH
VRALLIGLVLSVVASTTVAQPPEGPGRGFGPPGFGPPGGGPPGGFGGPGGPMGQERKLVEKFDTDGDERLNAEERATAREESPPANQGRGGPRFGNQDRDPPKPGIKVSPVEVEAYTDVDLYDPHVFRTIFLNFENPEWEKELRDFYNTDVEVPATLIVDGQEYHDVGVHNRGKSSFFMVPEGFKHSLNVSLDFVNKDQKLQNYKTLNLLNLNGDASMLSSVLYSHIARQYIPAPKANLVRVVINGENWGVFGNVEQFNKDFVKANYGKGKGARWKVTGSPNGDGGLRYMGDDIEEYRSRYTIKTDDNEDSWKALINLCKVLDETPPEELQATLEPILDIDSTLWFLALDVALVNSDGYWTRASDYSLFQDADDKFHVIPHDMNEAVREGGGGPGGRRGGGRGGRREGPPRGFRPGDPPPGDGPPEGGPPQGPPPGGPDGTRGFGPPGGGPPGFGPPGGFGGPGGGRGGGPREGGVNLDPLVGLDNDRTPLRSKLLAVPELRERYLAAVRTIAEDSLDWEQLGPIVADYRELIEEHVEADNKKLGNTEGFERSTAQDGGPGSLRDFLEKRRDFLFKATEDIDVGEAPEKHIAPVKAE